MSCNRTDYSHKDTSFKKTQIVISYYYCYYYYSMEMGLYPVAVVLQYTKKVHKITYTHTHTHTLSLQTTHKITNTIKYMYYTHQKHKMGLLQPNKEPKVEKSALITIWHRPYYRIMNWNNTIIQKQHNTDRSSAPLIRSN
jgi:hypothetical protein